MNTFKITIDGKNFDVTVNETDKDIATVEVNGTSYQVCYENCSTAASTIQRPTAQASARPSTATSARPSAGGGASSIKAPLPGTILITNVKVGDQVKRGDVLIVMEAMKMENNIMANKDGQVKAIHVTIGQTVAQDDALIDLA